MLMIAKLSKLDPLGVEIPLPLTTIELVVEANVATIGVSGSKINHNYPK